MDAQFRGEAVAHRVAALGFKAGEIAKIGVDAIDRFDTGGAGAYQAQGAGKLIGCGRPAFGVAVRLRAQSRGQILHAPGEAEEMRPAITIAAEIEYRGRRLGGDGDDGKARHRDEALHIRTAFRFRQQKAVGLHRDDGRYVILDEAASQRIDPYEELGIAAR